MPDTSIPDHINTGGSQFVLRLVKQKIEVTPTTKVSDFPPADFPGYADKAPPSFSNMVQRSDGAWIGMVNPSEWVIEENGPEKWVAGFVLFLATAWGDRYVCNGWFLKPVRMQNKGDFVNFAVDLQIEDVPVG